MRKDLKHKLFSRRSGPDGEEELIPDLSTPFSEYDSGRFLNSVDQLSAEDIPLSPGCRTKINGGEIVRRFFLVFFAAVFLVCCGLLVKDAFSKKRAAQIYDRLEEEFFGTGFDFGLIEPADEGEVLRLSKNRTDTILLSQSAMEEYDGETPPPVIAPEEHNEELEKMRAGLAALARINPDVYGWITVEGTQINYPLVQGEDNDHYLDHAYTGDYLPEGSIFVDYRNRVNVESNYNTVIYGHNLRDGRMFHDVTLFAEEEYMNNKRIYIYTLDGVFIYEPFSFYESRADYNYFKTRFTSAKEFISFAEEMQNNTAVVNKEIEFSVSDRLLTLSTCTNGYYTQRYALHARLVDVITD